MIAWTHTMGTAESTQRLGHDMPDGVTADTPFRACRRTAYTRRSFTTSRCSIGFESHSRYFGANPFVAAKEAARWIMVNLTKRSDSDPPGPAHPDPAVKVYRAANAAGTAFDFFFELKETTESSPHQTFRYCASALKETPTQRMCNIEVSLISNEGVGDGSGEHAEDISQGSCSDTDEDESVAAVNAVRRYERAVAQYSEAAANMTQRRLEAMAAVTISCAVAHETTVLPVQRGPATKYASLAALASSLPNLGTLTFASAPSLTSGPGPLSAEPRAPMPPTTPAPVANHPETQSAVTTDGVKRTKRDVGAQTLITSGPRVMQLSSWAPMPVPATTQPPTFDSTDPPTNALKRRSDVQGSDQHPGAAAPSQQQVTPPCQHSIEIEPDQSTQEQQLQQQERRGPVQRAINGMTSPHLFGCMEPSLVIAHTPTAHQQAGPNHVNYLPTPPPLPPRPTVTALVAQRAAQQVFLTGQQLSESAIPALVTALQFLARLPPQRQSHFAPGGSEMPTPAAPRSPPFPPTATAVDKPLPPPLPVSVLIPTELAATLQPISYSNHCPVHTLRRQIWQAMTTVLQWLRVDVDQTDVLREALLTWSDEKVMLFADNAPFFNNAFQDRDKEAARDILEDYFGFIILSGCR